MAAEATEAGLTARNFRMRSVQALSRRAGTA